MLGWPETTHHSYRTPTIVNDIQAKTAELVMMSTGVGISGKAFLVRWYVAATSRAMKQMMKPGHVNKPGLPCFHAIHTDKNKKSEEMKISAQAKLITSCEGGLGSSLDGPVSFMLFPVVANKDGHVHSAAVLHTMFDYAARYPQMPSLNHDRKQPGERRSP